MLQFLNFNNRGQVSRQLVHNKMFVSDSLLHRLDLDEMLLRSQGAGYFLVIIDEYVSIKYGGETDQPIQL